MDAKTVNSIIAMIDSRRETLNEQWAAAERGTRESGELLEAEKALADLKWAIVDEALEEDASAAAELRL